MVKNTDRTKPGKERTQGNNSKIQIMKGKRSKKKQRLTNKVLISKQLEYGNDSRNKAGTKDSQKAVRSDDFHRQTREATSRRGHPNWHSTEQFTQQFPK